MNDPQAAKAAAPTHCSLCKAEGDCALRFEKDGYRIYRCPACNVLFVYPTPTHEEIMAIYDADYFKRGNKYAPNITDKRMDPNWANDQLKLSLLEGRYSSGKLLDVGCAMGGFLDTAKDAGYDVSGVEVSKDAADHVANELNIEVLNSDLIDAQLPADSYDIVTLWDVIEHLEDPASVVAEVHRVLKPGGVFTLSTGDAGSLWARLTGSHWQLLTPPQHLFYYDNKSLEATLNRCGFRVVEMRHLSKVATVDFILFKANEAFGKIVAPIRAAANLLGLGRLRLRINLFDIVSVVAVKQ